MRDKERKQLTNQQPGKYQLAQPFNNNSKLSFIKSKKLKVVKIQRTLFRKEMEKLLDRLQDSKL